MLYAECFPNFRKDVRPFSDRPSISAISTPYESLCFTLDISHCHRRDFSLQLFFWDDTIPSSCYGLLLLPPVSALFPTTCRDYNELPGLLQPLKELPVRFCLCQFFFSVSYSSPSLQFLSLVAVFLSFFFLLAYVQSQCTYTVSPLRWFR